MSDKELLELACIASERGRYLTIGGCGHTKIPSEKAIRWDPLNDDGDAFRLAISIGIEFGKFEDNHYWARHWSDGKIFRESGEKSGFQDKLAAARRAIVRAAAEIGKKL